MAKWSNFNNCKFIHISTDFVYDGNSLDPYAETNETNPLNNYGKSKLLGDLACQKYNHLQLLEQVGYILVLVIILLKNAI